MARRAKTRYMMSGDAARRVADFAKPYISSPGIDDAYAGPGMLQRTVTVNTTYSVPGRSSSQPNFLSVGLATVVNAVVTGQDPVGNPVITLSNGSQSIRVANLSETTLAPGYKVATWDDSLRVYVYILGKCQT